MPYTLQQNGIAERITLFTAARTALDNSSFPSAFGTTAYAMQPSNTIAQEIRARGAYYTPNGSAPHRR